MVVQAVVDRLESRLHVTEIHDPAGLRTRLALHLQFHPEGVAVQARAFVPRRHVGEAVRRLEHEDFEDFHVAIVRRRRPISPVPRCPSVRKFFSSG
ncbi:hypothetical protein D3C73_1155970 [compost metagenome]